MSVIFIEGDKFDPSAGAGVSFVMILLLISISFPIFRPVFFNIFEAA